MTNYNRILRAVTRTMSISLGGLTLLSIMVLVVVSIITRSFGEVIVGSYEITGLLLSVTAAYAICYATIEKGHVIIEAFTSKFPHRFQRRLNIFGCFISFIISAGMVWALVNYAIKYGCMENTPALNLPFLPFQIIWGLGLVLTSLVFLANMYQVMKSR